MFFYAYLLNATQGSTAKHRPQELTPKLLAARRNRHPQRFPEWTTQKRHFELFLATFESVFLGVGLRIPGFLGIGFAWRIQTIGVVDHFGSKAMRTNFRNKLFSHSPIALLIGHTVIFEFVIYRMAEV